MTTSFASLINLGGLREALRIRTGLPEEGDSGKTRANRCLNYALREFFGDLPHMFERDEHRFQLGVKYSNSTLDVCPTDARVFRITSTDTDTLPTSHTMVGRWIDITDSTGKVHRKKVCRVTTDICSNPTWAGIADNTTHTIIIVDSPWLNVTDEELAYAIFTLDYPLPADWREVSEVHRLDGSSSPRLLTHVFPEGMERLRMDSDDWLAEGTPEQWTRGDFAQIRAPHETPSVALWGSWLPGVINTDAEKRLSWGFDDTPDGHGDVGVSPQYEPAGTFKYCYCLVWGSLDLTPFFRDLNQTEPSFTEYFPRPFLISAPSAPTAEIVVQWTGPAPVIRSTNQDVAQFYTDAAQASYQMSGLRKWWFRARVATEASPSTIPGAGSPIKVEADGEFYLFRVGDAYETEFTDRGDWGAPIISFPLKDFVGHQTIRFNRIPADGNTTIIVRGRRLPDLLKYDSDMARCPSDCMDALVYLAAAILTGERAADMKKVAEYRELYAQAVKKLRKKYAISAGHPTPMGSIEGSDLPAGFPTPVEF